MTTLEKQIELRDKIIIGLEKVFKKLIAFKKEKNSKFVILNDNQIVEISPDDIRD